MTEAKLSLPLVKYHAWQGQTNDCAPFVVANVINALCDKTSVDGAQLAREMNRPRWRFTSFPFLIIRRIPNWATFPWGMVDVFEQYGIRARWRIGATAENLRHAIRADRVAMPIVGEWMPPHKMWAHVRALAAWHADHGWGFVDPAHPSGEIVWQHDERFTKLWRNWGNLLVELV